MKYKRDVIRLISNLHNITNKIGKDEVFEGYRVTPLHVSKDGFLSLRASYRRNGIYRQIALENKLIHKTNPLDKQKNKLIQLKIIHEVKTLNIEMKKILSGEFRKYNFLEFFEICIDRPTGDGMQRAKSTKKNWLRMLKHLKRFLNEKYLTDDIDFKRVNFAFYSELHSWIVNDPKQKAYSKNTFWSIVKRFTKYAINEKQIDEPNLYMRIQDNLRIKRPKIVRTEKDYLTLDEIKQMSVFPYYPRYKTPFIFNCFVGLRISDLKHLRWSDLTFDFSEMDIIEKKTGKQNHQPLHPYAIKMLNELAKNRKDDNGTVFNLPKDDWKTNKHLKRWSESAGITKKVRTHTMRRTFINILEQSGVSLLNTSQLANHSSTKITEQYYSAKKMDMLKQDLQRVPSIDDIAIKK